MKTCAGISRKSVMCGCILGCAVVVVAPAIAREGNSAHGQLEVSPQGLCIKGIVFRKTIPLSDLQVSSARIVDFDQEQGLRPWIKLYGIGLPFFRSGWYLLKDHEKALLLITGAKSVVYVPTTRGYALLLSPDRPEEFLAALQRPALDGQVFTVLPRKGER